MKTQFIAYYDYGHGAVLMFVYARSSTEITYAYPELQILDSLPVPMTPEEEAKMATVLLFDIDAPPTDVLDAILGRRADGA